MLTLKSHHKYILALIKANKLRLFLAMLCMLMMAIATSATAFLVKPVLDDIFVNKDLQMLTLLPLVVILIYLMRGVGMYGQAYFMSYVGQHIIQHLRNLLYHRIQDLSLAFFQEEQTGVLMSRITHDVNIVKGMVSTAVTSALRDCFTILGLTFVIFYRDWRMALFALIILPIAFFPIVQFGRRVRRVSTGVQEAMADMSSFLHETLAGNKIVKAFGMEAHEKKRFDQRTADLFRMEMKAVVAKSLSSPVMEFLGGLGVAFVIWYGGYRVIHGTSTPGTFFSFMTAVLLLYDPVKKLSGLNNSIQEGLSAADRIFDIIERPSTIQEIAQPGIIPDGPHGVRFENVSFAYHGSTSFSRPVLQDLNLNVAPGEIVALVGMSGGGKTTLVNLIPRFYDVTAGTIYIDDLDIRRASIASLRRQIAIVTQEPILFNDSIYYNIGYGNFNASSKEVENAARAAFAWDFIQKLPNGLNTSIGELGSRLSGGEKQRLCIARALLKNAPILILDEATSSLDSEAELLVQKALENLMQGRTTFVIAHRLSTIANAHRIVVLLDGRIAETGTHAQLLARGGEYSKLYHLQFDPATASAAGASTAGRTS